MALIDTPDQAALGKAVRQLVTAHSPMTRVREIMAAEASYDAGVWRRLVDLGLPGITVPEDLGGSGGSVADLAVALRELGRGLVPSPLVACVLAAQALLVLGDEPVSKELLPQIAGGELLATVALGAAVPEAPQQVTEQGGTVTGVLRGVLHGADADVLLVPAGDGLLLVRAGAPGLTVTPQAGLDATTAIATVKLVRTPATRLAGDATAALSRTTDLAHVAVACAQSAAMRHALDVTADYAKVRYSFGQPIGAYQGVKHKLADVYTDWCLVDAATRRAVEALDGDEPGASAAAAAARVLSGPAYVNAARQMMMLHGGIGFTWEHDAHLYYKNAVSSSVLLGGRGAQLDRLADLLDV